MGIILQRRFVAASLLVFTVVTIEFFLHDTIDSFNFKDFALMEHYKQNGKIPETELFFSNNPIGYRGFYAIGIILMHICGISWNHLPFLPIMPLAALLIYINIKRSVDYIGSCLLLLCIILNVNNYATLFCFYVHGVGLLLFMFTIFIIFHTKISGARSSLILVSIIALNYMTYKATLWMLVLLISLCIIYYIVYNKSEYNQIKIAAILIIFTLLFNQFVYSNVFPLFDRLGDFEPGVDRIMSRIFFQEITTYDALNDLYYAPPSIWTLSKLIIFATFITTVIIYFVDLWKSKTFRDHRTIGIDDVVSIVLLSVGISSVFIYNILGFFEYKILLLFGSFVNIRLLKSNYKSIVIPLLILIILLNLLYFPLSIAYKFEVSHKDNNYFSYIGPSAEWLISFSSDSMHIKTDVLTAGYFIGVKSERKSLIDYPNYMLRDDILDLLGKDQLKTNTYYLINYKLDFVSITGWNVLRSLNNLMSIMESNHHLNKIYTSRDVVIYNS